MNTQVLELNDQDLKAIHGGGTTADITDGLYNTVSFADFSIDKLVESLF